MRKTHRGSPGKTAAEAIGAFGEVFPDQTVGDRQRLVVEDTLDNP